MSASRPVRVRFPPSPTGFLHIGSLRTALYNQLFARHHGGTFILRVEDTDRTRFVEGAVENLCRSLRACGVIPDEGVWMDEQGKIIQRGDYGPYIQSERKQRHLDYAKQLIDRSKAYYCFCSEERLERLRKDQQAAGAPTMYDGHCRDLSEEEIKERLTKQEKHVIRLKLPKQGQAVFQDLIRGEISFEWSLIDDQVLIKSDGFPTYHLAAMCDDHDMEITHIIRGEEWLSSTPKHVFLFEAFGWTVPHFAHLPLLLNPDRSKLSKRQGDVAVEDYLAKGYLPEALVNFVALLGWNPTGNREMYTHEELAEYFDLAKVNKAGAVFNAEKLDWLNAQYLKSMPVEDYLALTLPFLKDSAHDMDFATRCLLLIRDRVIKPQDAVALTSFFFETHLDYSSVSLTWKTQTADEARTRLEAARTVIESLSDTEALSAGSIETRIKELIATNGWGNGEALWPLRVALSGQEKSPGPFELVATYGKERTLGRLQDAIRFLT